MLIIKVIIEFFKTGLFAVGGGLATIPFLKEMSINYDWFSLEELHMMVSVAESTPGPIGVNMATYVGYNLFGILGGLVTTLSLVAPSIIVILIVSTIMDKFKDSALIKVIFKYLRAAVLGLILYAIIDVFKDTLFNKTTFINVKQMITYIVMLIFSYKFKKLSPIITIAICALVGIVFAF